MTNKPLKIKKIESDSNPVYRKLLSLQKSRGIVKEGECLIGGEKVIAEILRDRIGDLKNSYWVFCADEHELFTADGPDTLIHLSKTLFNQIDALGTRAPLLCVPVPALEDWNPESSPTSTEVLCALGDPGNLGALMRSAEAFGVSTVVLLEEACHPFHPKVIKSSSGSVFRLRLFRGPSIGSLQGVKNIFALDRDGSPLKSCKFPAHPRILLGEEGLGLPENLAVQKVGIPIRESVESLNATIAAGILFYELSSK